MLIRLILILIASLFLTAFRGIEPFPQAGGGRDMVEEREAQYQQELMDQRQDDIDRSIRSQESQRSLYELEESGRRNERLHKGFSDDDCY